MGWLLAALYASWSYRRRAARSLVQDEVYNLVLGIRNNPSSSDDGSTKTHPIKPLVRVALVQCDVGKSSKSTSVSPWPQAALSLSADVVRSVLQGGNPDACMLPNSELTQAVRLTLFHCDSSSASSSEGCQEVPAAACRLEMFRLDIPLCHSRPACDS